MDPAHRITAIYGWGGLARDLGSVAALARSRGWRRGRLCWRARGWRRIGSRSARQVRASFGGAHGYTSPSSLPQMPLRGALGCALGGGLAFARSAPRAGQDWHRSTGGRVVMSAAERPRSARGASFLNCPRCGLSIRSRASWLAVEHCPRCLARARIAVRLFSSPLPVAELYPEGDAPSVERNGVPTTAPRGSS